MTAHETLVDSSAWIEYLRATESGTDQRLTELVSSSKPLLTTGPVVMEILAGTTDPQDRMAVDSVLAACRKLALDESGDWDTAADIYRSCRRGGVTPRKMIDCLIAAIAIRCDVPILAQDRDYALIAEHTALRLAD